MSVASIDQHSLLSRVSGKSADFIGPKPGLPHRATQDAADLASVFSVIDDSVDWLSGRQVPREQALFVCRIMMRTLDSLRNARYSDFDAITTSHSCHGIAIYALGLVTSLQDVALEDLIAQGEGCLREIESVSDLEVNFSWVVPKSLVRLARLHVLHLIREPDTKRGAFTNKDRIREIARLGRKLIDALVSRLQKAHSNLAANSYYTLSEGIDGNTKVSGVPLSMWRECVHPEKLRKDKRGVLYASNLHSMQVSGALLSSMRAKVAFVNDFQDEAGVCKGRHITLYEGDGRGNFRELSSDGIKTLAAFRAHTPVVVFGGCSRQASDETVRETISWMGDWKDRLWELILACDVHYPPFPRVSSDPDFDSSPIPSEGDVVRGSIESHSHVQGVRSTDPYRFCLTHIYLASALQVVSSALPTSYIPRNKSIASECGQQSLSSV